MKNCMESSWIEILRMPRAVLSVGFTLELPFSDLFCLDTLLTTGALRRLRLPNA